MTAGAGAALGSGTSPVGELGEQLLEIVSSFSNWKELFQVKEVLFS